MTTSADRRPTLDEVAARAGVSRSVASRVMNNSPQVSPEKRGAVQKAVQELGYTPDRTARALATRQTGVVALAVSGGSELIADPFFAQIIVGVSSALEETDLHLLLCLATTDHDHTRLANLLNTGGVDAMMLLAPRADDPLDRIARTARIPVVFGGRSLRAEPEHYVDADNLGGARAATEHLISRGRTRIATIRGLADLDVTEARYRGYEQALTAAGLAPYGVAAGDYTATGGAGAMTALLRTHPDLDAVVAANDNMAAGALRVLRAAGLSVPRDVAVTGFDDLAAGADTEPPLTTVHQPLMTLGREMARMLVALLNGADPSPLILPTHLVVRAST